MISLKRHFVSFKIISVLVCLIKFIDADNNDFKFPNSNEDDMIDLRPNTPVVPEQLQHLFQQSSQQQQQQPNSNISPKPSVVSFPAVQQPQSAASIQTPIVLPIPTIPNNRIPKVPIYDIPSANYNFITDFGWNLFQATTLPNRISNLAISPILVEMILSELEGIAAGNTKNEINTILKGATPQALTTLMTDVQMIRPPNQLQMTSAVFASQDLSLNQSFVTKTRSKNIAVIPINFRNPEQAATKINGWIANATNNNIRELYKPSELNAQRLLLINSLYFRGSWKYEFTESTVEPFEIQPNIKKTTTFMKQVQRLRGGEFLLSGGGATVQWVELPYQGNELSMVLIVPSVRNNLDEVVRQMVAEDLTYVIQQLHEPYRRTVHLKMPKFQIETSFSLVNALLKLGLVDTFTIQSQLPYLTTNHEPIQIGDLIQKTIIKVDEKGTIAASVTSVSVVALSLSYIPESLILNVDHPFLAIIIDRRNKIPLLITEVFDP